MRKNKILTHRKTIAILGLACSSLFIQAKASSLNNSLKAIPDSVGMEIVNGELVVIHKIEPKETYYQLGRIYNVQVNNIMSANNKKSLRPGDTVKIPTGRKPSNKAIVSETVKSATAAQQQQAVLTEYKVGKNETLYAIGRRFNTSVSAIKTLNNLTSESLKEGQVLQIPNADFKPVVVRPQIDTSEVEDERASTIDDSDFKGNKYGIREKKEKGIGVWMENLESNGKSNLALHKTAPIGTIIKITNPMTQNVTYAKVVGKFTDNTDTQGAIVVLSKSAASYIGALDRRFLIEIAYGLPLQ